MGTAVASLAPQYDCDVAAVLDSHSNPAGEALARPLSGIDVVVDFSVAAAVVRNLPLVAKHGVNVVVGTTGWQAHEAALRRVAEEAGIGVVAAPNFSIGAVLTEAIVRHAAALFAAQPAYGAWIHELHHAAKRDAPSGTAVALAAAMRQAGYDRDVPIASSRAGSAPGTHTVGFDGPCESLTIAHAVRDRAVFAHGALVAARWVHGRKGWYGMRDVLGLT